MVTDGSLDAIERRSHGCDGCRQNIPTERFDGYRGNHLWLCTDCLKRIVGHGLKEWEDKKE